MSQSQIQSAARKSLLRRGIFHLIGQGDDIETILNRLIENVEAQAEQMLAAVFFYSPTSQDLCVGAAPNLQPVYKKAVNGFKIGPQQPACGSAVFKKERVICSDVQIDPLWEKLRAFAAAADIRAVWSEPIFDDAENVLGTVAFYFSEPKSPTSADLVVLEATAELAAVVIQCREEEFLEKIAVQKQSLVSCGQE